MGLEIDRRLELKGIDEEIFRGSERKYTRASLLALSETEVCKRLSPVGFDAVSLGLSRLDAGETVESWEILADSPVDFSDGRDSDSLSEPLEGPNSSSGTSGTTESCSLLGPIERPNWSRGILPTVNTSGRTESHSLLGPFEPPDSRDEILTLPSGRTQSHSLLGPIERPNSKSQILPPASTCGNGLLPPPPCTLQIPPGFCSLSESPSPCLNLESKPQNADAPHLKAEVLDQSLETGFSLLSKSDNPYRPPRCDHMCCSCLTEAPELKAEVLDQSLDTGVSLLSKSANPYRPPHCREAQAQLDAKVESDAECSPKLHIGEMEIQSVNLEAKKYSNLVSPSGLTASDGCFGSKVDCLRHCELPGIIASRINQTGIIFGDLGEFVCDTELHDMKADELDFEDVWSEVSAKMRFEQEMELKRGPEHDETTLDGGTVAGSENEKCLSEDNCDDHSCSADSDAPICWLDEDSLISIDDMLKIDVSALEEDDMLTLDISTLEDDEEDNSVKEDTSKAKAMPKQEGARREILEDIARVKRKSGQVLPLPLLLPHQMFHMYHSPSSGATTLTPPSPPLSAAATASIPPPPPPSSAAATAPIPPPPRPSSGGATAPIRSPPRPLKGGATAPIPPPRRPFSGGATGRIPPLIRPHGTGTFYVPPPIPWGYRPAYVAPVYTQFYQVSSNFGG